MIGLLDGLTRTRFWQLVCLVGVMEYMCAVWCVCRVVFGAAFVVDVVNLVVRRRVLFVVMLMTMCFIGNFLC